MRFEKSVSPECTVPRSGSPKAPPRDTRFLGTAHVSYHLVFRRVPRYCTWRNSLSNVSENQLTACNVVHGQYAEKYKRQRDFLDPQHDPSPFMQLLIVSAARLSWVSSDERRGGSEDPWLCVTSFGWICLYRNVNYPAIAILVNSGMCLLMAPLGQLVFVDRRLISNRDRVPLSLECTGRYTQT